MRRSALDFLGGKQIDVNRGVSAIFAVTAQPLSADFARTRFIQLSCMLIGSMGYNRASTDLAGLAELEQVKSGDRA